MASATPKPPVGLVRSGAALWRSIVADVPADCDLDARELAMLGQACRAADHLAALEAVVKKEGVTSRGSTGQRVVHPAVAEARMQRLVVLRLLSAIGLDEHVAESPAVSPASLQARRAANARYARRDGLRALRGGAS